MFGMTVFLYYRIKAILRNRLLIRRARGENFGENAQKYSQMLKKYAGHPFLQAEDANKAIEERILSGEPFLAARYGGFEVLNMRTFDFRRELKGKKEVRFKLLCNNAGFFPEDIRLGNRFAQIMKEASREVDLLAVWYNEFEDYYAKKLLPKNAECCYLDALEPWSVPHAPWSRALKGKKVLVIHPFAQTVRSQYQKRETLFPGTEILPEFELLTLKAVQTVAGERDDRFATWFDALDWMYQEAMKTEFDIAILGCGAYGFPLAAKIKQAGKQAIHLGGATQLLFGIKGKRWDEKPEYQYVRDRFTEDWVYPGEQDRPKNAKAVENGCYW